MYCRQGILAELILWFDFFIDISGPKLCAKLIINKNDLLFSICSFMTLRKGLTLGWSNIDFFLNIQIISADIIFFGREIWILKFTKNQTSDSDPRHISNTKNHFAMPLVLLKECLCLLYLWLVTNWWRPSLICIT